MKPSFCYLFKKVIVIITLMADWGLKLFCLLKLLQKYNYVINSANRGE